MDFQRFSAGSSQGLADVDHPFAQHLKPLHDAPLDPLFLLAPLPMQSWFSQHDSPGFGASLRGFSLALGDLSLVSLAGPAVEQQLTDVVPFSLLYVTSGEVSLFAEDVYWTARAGSCLLIPGGSSAWRSSSCSLVCLMLEWTMVLDLLEGLLPQGPALRAALASRGATQLITGVNNALMAAVLASLDRNLRLLSQLLGINQAMLNRLGLDRQIITLVLLLAFPELSRHDLMASDKVPTAGLDSVFDDLIAYIKANLDQPLNLTQLERQSHYSRRTLQYAFRERFGCTPTQWIRAQRLDLAYRLLSHPDREASVASIALACGYRSTSLFSIEFQQRFHCKPSQLLRESRAS